MFPRRIEAALATGLFAVAAVALPAAASSSAGTSGAVGPAATVTPTTTTTTRTTSGTPCPTFSVPRHLTAGDVAMSHNFDYGGIYNWRRSKGGDTPTAQASAAHSGELGMLVPSLSAGPVQSSSYSQNGSGTFKASVWVRLAEGQPDAVVQLRVVSTLEGTQLAKVKKKVSAGSWVQLSRQYVPGWHRYTYNCNGTPLYMFSGPKSVEYELSVAGKKVTSPVTLKVDDFLVTLVSEKPAEPPVTTGPSRTTTSTSTPPPGTTTSHPTNS